MSIENDKQTNKQLSFTTFNQSLPPGVISLLQLTENSLDGSSLKSPRFLNIRVG